jgi:hypothetical protein
MYEKKISYLFIEKLFKDHQALKETVKCIY